MKKAKVSQKPGTKEKGTLPPPDKIQQKKRIPRPLGITLLMKEYKRTNNRELLTKARNQVIEQWSNNNFQLFDKQVSIDELAKYLITSPQLITKKIVQPMKNWLLNEKVEDRYEALVSYLIKMGLATRAQTQNHIQVLSSGQTIHNGLYTYTPFVSGEVTKALALIHKSDENFLKIIQEFRPTRPSIAVQNNFPGADHQQSPLGNYLGVNEAVKLLDAQRDGLTLLDDVEAQTKLLAEHIPDNLPEINATKQQGLSADGQSKPTPKRDHSKRREHTGDIYSSDIIIP